MALSGGEPGAVRWEACLTATAKESSQCNAINNLAAGYEFYCDFPRYTECLVYDTEPDKETAQARLEALMEGRYGQDTTMDTVDIHPKENPLARVGRFLARIFSWQSSGGGGCSQM